MMIRMLGGVMQATPDEISGEMFQSRITPFMAEADHRQSIIVTVNNKSFRLKKKTRRNGHFEDWLTIPKADVDQVATESNGRRSFPVLFSMEDQANAPVAGSVFLHRPEGISVISDIDDTIKDTAVGDRRELLANTFLREFRSIEGMADVYQDWAADGANFHYVSSSPWQLFSSLQQLHAAHGFPEGTMHLRNFRLRDQLLKRVILRRKGKATAIRMLMESMPGRDFVLIGDSGEKDPKIYRKICRQYGDRIKAVFIRDVDHRPLDDERFQKLSESLTSGRCARFSSAQQLREQAECVFSGVGC
jgi:phosphatidate phosphatase APP1